MSLPLCPIAITAKLRNSVLQKAIRKVGTGTALAAALGVTPSQVSYWASLGGMPGRKWRDEQWERVGYALAQVLGRWYEFEEVFPAELYSAVASGRVPRQIDKHVEVNVLSLSEVSPALLLAGATPESDAEDAEKSSAIKARLRSLTPKQQFVLESAFGMNGPEMTDREIATELGVSSGRVQQIRKKAISRLRHKVHTDKLNAVGAH